MMVDLKSMKNQASINIQKGPTLNNNGIIKKKCMNRARWVGFGLKVTALCNSMNRASRSESN